MSHNFSIPEPILAVPYSCCAGGADACCACASLTTRHGVNIHLTLITPPPSKC